jgi:hypothetical protein
MLGSLLSHAIPKMLGLRFSITVGPFFIRVDLRNALAAPYSTECSFIAVVEERKARSSESLLQLGHLFFSPFVNFRFGTILDGSRRASSTMYGATLLYSNRWRQ